MIFPSRDIFLELAKQGNLIPVYMEIVADIETPVSAYMKLDTGSHTFLLESSEPNERFGRYSFIGTDPAVVFQVRDKQVTVNDRGDLRTYETDRDPLVELETIMAKYKPIVFGDLPIFFGGAVGFMSYESVRFFEPTVGMAPVDDLEVPDAYYIVSDSLVIFDNMERKIKILAMAYVDGNPEAAYTEAIHKIEKITERLRQPVAHKVLTSSKQVTPTSQASTNMTQEQYIKMTESMQEYIRSGDIFQVVPSQRFALPSANSPIELYRALRYINPSPYMFCLKFGKLAAIGASPETHVRCENRRVTLRPIAGTRPRRFRQEDDDAMARELLSDPKERAEHLMLVDLARNDIGRVCEYKSVQVTDFMTIEKYSHVMHIVSNVEGNLRQDKTLYDVMRSTFPNGTVTGAPKVRAMQIIAEKEPTRRGTYAGVVGYFSFSGNMDFCIALRTILLKDELAYVQAGGGLVADSTPLGEYQESVNKAKACLKAVALASTFQ